MPVCSNPHNLETSQTLEELSGPALEAPNAFVNANVGTEFLGSSNFFPSVDSSVLSLMTGSLSPGGEP